MKMKKDIEWLKAQICIEMMYLEHIRKEWWPGVKYQTLRSVVQKINQLDEPEVLSQEWIDNNSINASHDGVTDEYVHVDDLENLLVPKRELPVIPKYVAEWYESEGKLSSWWNWFYKWGRDESRSDLETKTIRWMQDYNEEKFVDMFLHGYEVEEEPKYHALMKGHELVHDYDIYWNYDKSNHDVFVSRLHPPLDNFTTEMSKAEWNKRGINESNADFVKVDG